MGTYQVAPERVWLTVRCEICSERRDLGVAVGTVFEHVHLVTGT